MGCVCVVSSARHDENRMDKNNGSLENKWTNWIRNFYLLSEWVWLSIYVIACMLFITFYFIFVYFIFSSHLYGAVIVLLLHFFLLVSSSIAFAQQTYFFPRVFFVRCSCNLFRFYCVRFFFSLYIKFKQTLNALHESDFKAVFVWIWVSVCIQQKNCNRNC